ncbi:MAG: alanine racemase [Acidaminococcus provencensis]|jgi:alanine racemase|uniref:alanine racemase n=1 Tax=Acidaminococcus TaxID=904 RepID=UPI000CF9C972|nr:MULTISPECIES: alanine racemase [Acidaminococcus]MCH4097345.1 alanine racemase [Acidaminococcus provencensis]RHK01245.1 alanine racemase [Acidaminococcus sp. AM05-11]
MEEWEPRRVNWLEIDLDALEQNFKNYKAMVGPDIKIMPAIKVNAYGHGIIACAKVLEEAGADYLGVGTVEEGILLREQGVKMPILIFASNLLEETAPLYVEHRLIPTVLSLEGAKAVAQAAGQKKQDIFIGMDTGRGRLGVNAEKFPELFRSIQQLPQLHVEGVYSHMAKVGWPDADNQYALWQRDRFQKAMDAIGKAAEAIPFRQLANTPAGIALPELRFTGVCPGRAMWGYSPLEKRPGHPEFTAPLKAWKSRLIHVNEVWGGKFGPNFSAVQLTAPKRIGIMAGGIGDGFQAPLSQGYVLLNGRKCPVASSLSLEHTILDLTDFPEAKPGDEIVILGRQGEEEITLEQHMKDWNLNIPKVWVTISRHIDRQYYRHGKLWAVGRENKLIYVQGDPK